MVVIAFRIILNASNNEDYNQNLFIFPPNNNSNLVIIKTSNTIFNLFSSLSKEEFNL